VRDGVEAVEGIPVQWVAADVPQGVALWLTHLGGSAEQTAPMLTRLAKRGLLAISFDPPGHGRRGAGGEPCELAGEVLAAFRRRMWPLAGRTVLESLRVLRTGVVGDA
jgi:alpha-beta hydrolase superfamily lysophospholipase